MVTPGTLTTEEAQILTTTPPQPPMELGHQLRVEFLYKIVSDHKNKKSFKKTLVSTEKDMLLWSYYLMINNNWYLSLFKTLL